METDLKTKRNYKIHIQWPGKTPEDILVLGYRVIIPNFKDYEFFVHRFPWGSNTWRISEVTTGFAAPDRTYAATRQEAIENFTCALNEKGNDGFKKIIETALKIKESNSSLDKVP